MGIYTYPSTLPGLKEVIHISTWVCTRVIEMSLFQSFIIKKIHLTTY